MKVVDKQENLIMKASYIFGGIPWAQPFSGGNKRTAFVCADTLLRLNGFRLAIDDENEKNILENY